MTEPPKPPEPSKASKTLGTPETSNPLRSFEYPETRETPETVKTTEDAENPETVKTGGHPGTPASAETSGSPGSPGSPGTTDTPGPSGPRTASGPRRSPLRALLPDARAFLRRRAGVVAVLAGWSSLEAGQTFLMGFALARALDDGFLKGRAVCGLAWLGVAGAAVLVGAFGTGRVYRAVAALTEPLRDGLVRRVVARALREAVERPHRTDTAAVSRLTHQVEIARDTFAGLVMVLCSFVFTAAGALAGLASLAPALLLAVVPPLVLGLVLFTVTLRPMARRQQAFLAADEAIASGFGELASGLRDTTACGGEDLVAGEADEWVGAELREARRLARWSVLRVLAVAVGGRLPVVLLLAMAPWLLSRGVTAGMLAGAFAYLTQSLLPALQGLMNGLGTAGARLVVVLDRLTAGTPPPPPPATDAPGRPRTCARPGRGAAPPATGGLPGAATPNAPAPASGPAAAPAPVVPVPCAPARAAGPASAVPPVPASAAAGRHAAPAAAASAAAPSGSPAPGSATPHAPSSPRFPAPRPPTARPPAVELRGVTFAYGRGARPVVSGLDLVVPDGGHLAVVGPSGTGKSTLAALVAGLLRPSEGEIAVCGQPVRDRPACELARLRVLIPQEAYVFSGGVRDNLGYLLDRALPDAEAWSAARAVGALGLLERLGGPDAPVDPAALSAGERQLLALARAYLSPAPVVLLDEATCHLDPSAEARAEAAFARRPGTLIVIAHRTGSARRAARVLVMDGAHAVSGGHEELVEGSALYRDLVGRWGTEPPVPSQPALAPRYPDGVDPVARPGLAVDRGHVVAHGPVGQVQGPGDLRNGRALRRE